MHEKWRLEDAGQQPHPFIEEAGLVSQLELIWQTSELHDQRRNSGHNARGSDNDIQSTEKNGKVRTLYTLKREITAFSSSGVFVDITVEITAFSSSGVFVDINQFVHVYRPINFQIIGVHPPMEEFEEICVFYSKYQLKCINNPIKLINKIISILPYKTNNYSSIP